MAQCAILKGRSRAFTEELRKTIEDCGVEAFVEGAAPDDVECDIAVYEAGGDGGVLNAVGGAGGAEARPFLVYAGTDVSQDELPALRERGLVGVITPKSTPEEVAFFVHKALFYGKMIRRNPRAPVNIPVELQADRRTIKTFSSVLSRDGMFVVTLNPLPVNSACEIRFELPGASRAFKTGVKVLYNIAINKELNIIASPSDPFKRLVSHPGMAVFFTGLTDEEKDLIDAYVKSLE